MRREAFGFTQDPEDRETSKWLCAACIRDSYVKRIRNYAGRRLCFGCGDSRYRCLAMPDLAKMVEQNLLNHFSIDEDEINQSSRPLSLPEVVSIMLDCASSPACEKIAQIIYETSGPEDFPFLPGRTYRRTQRYSSDAEAKRLIENEWKFIKLELTHGRRFFNERVQAFFGRLMVEAMTAKLKEAPDVRPAIRRLPEQSILYRARLAISEETVDAILRRPSTELGAPPKERAANNRMSPGGIPVMYLSNDKDTCIAELRPAIGDIVAVGAFRTTQPMKFFDFTGLSEGLDHTPLSYLDPDAIERAQLRLLLTYLHDQIAQPVRDHDTDYVITQALAEFIRYDGVNAFDGIVFRSVQNAKGINYVLFDRSDILMRNLISSTPKYHLSIKTEDVSINRVSAVAYRAEEVSQASPSRQ